MKYFNFERVTEEGVLVVVTVKTYPGAMAVVGLGVAGDGCDLTPVEAKRLGEHLIRAAEVAS